MIHLLYWWWDYLNEKLPNAISTSHANQFVTVYPKPVPNRVLTAHIASSGPPSNTKAKIKAKITTFSIPFFTEFLLVNEGGQQGRPCLVLHGVDKLK